MGNDGIETELKRRLKGYAPKVAGPVSNEEAIAWSLTGDELLGRWTCCDHEAVLHPTKSHRETYRGGDGIGSPVLDENERSLCGSPFAEGSDAITPHRLENAGTETPLRLVYQQGVEVREVINWLPVVAGWQYGRNREA